MAKQGQIIEAHYAGTVEMCLSFIQKSASNIPRGACIVKSDLSGIKEEGQVEMCPRLISSWELSNVVQRAIEGDAMIDLPSGLFCLDTEQQAIVSSRPPLLIESRSGTGKTNVLFQHGVTLSRKLVHKVGSMPLCVVTLSKLLRSQLQQMYREIEGLDNTALNSCMYMSLYELLDGLACRMKMKWQSSDATTFNEYTLGRKAHSSLSIDPSLIENEIGGVIMGSLRSAELRRPLNWEEYRADCKSNISNKDCAGSATRRGVYDHFILYQKWKKESKRFDINDMVLGILKILGDGQHEIFSGVYLDEIQDFSYAMIYLICSIGGASTLA